MTDNLSGDSWVGVHNQIVGWALPTTKGERRLLTRRSFVNLRWAEPSLQNSPPACLRGGQCPPYGDTNVSHDNLIIGPMTPFE